MATHIDTFLRPFAQPDPAFGPVPIWWWSGEPLQIDRLRWQMDRMLAMGIRDALVLNLAASGPIFGSDADDPPFMSHAWWTIFAQVCDHARAIGTSIWFYDQIGFSGANFQADLVARRPDFAGQHLASVVAEGEGELSVTCPAAGEPIGAYVADTDGGAPEFVAIDGRAATYRASRPRRLRLVYRVERGFDYFSPDACAALIDTVHGEFARRLPGHLGTTIRGSFQDELPNLPTWGRTFAESYAAASGIGRDDLLYALFEEGGAAERRARLAYHRHRADLAEAALFHPLHAWHEPRGLLAGFDQQGPARGADAVACVEKYADYVRTHRWYGAPGCDQQGHAKLHASIALLYGRSRVWIEGFHSTSWGGTLADTFDWLIPFLQNGATLYDPHAIYYGMRKGWWEWAPPSTCFRQPYAMHYRGFAQMIARLTKLLAHGTHEADVAVLMPTASVQASRGVDSTFPPAAAAERALRRTIGRMMWHAREPAALDEAGLAYHLVDEPSLCAATLDASEFILRGVAFHTLVLPDVSVIDDATAEWIAAFARSGGRVIVIGVGRVETPATRAIDLAALPNIVRLASADELVAIGSTLPRQVGAPVPVLHRRDGARHVVFVPAVAGMATRIEFTGRFHYLDHATIDPAAYRASADLTLPSSARNIVRFDPIDGTAQPIACEGGRVRLDFGGAPFAVPAWDDRDEAREGTSTAGTATVERVLPTTWTSRFEPTLDLPFNDVGTAEEACTVHASHGEL